MVTHSGLTAGYQVAQTAHAVANFARFDSDAFIRWHSHSQFLVALQTPCSDTLEELLTRAVTVGLRVFPFREPDVGDSLTAVAFAPDVRVRGFLSGLPLAGKHVGSVDKHHANQAKSSSPAKPAKPAVPANSSGSADHVNQVNHVSQAGPGSVTGIEPSSVTGSVTCVPGSPAVRKTIHPDPRPVTRSATRQTAPDTMGLDTVLDTGSSVPNVDAVDLTLNPSSDSPVVSAGGSAAELFVPQALDRCLYSVSRDTPDGTHDGPHAGNATDVTASIVTSTPASDATSDTNSSPSGDVADVIEARVSNSVPGHTSNESPDSVPDRVATNTSILFASIFIESQER